MTGEHTVSTPRQLAARRYHSQLRDVDLKDRSLGEDYQFVSPSGVSAPQSTAVEALPPSCVYSGLLGFFFTPLNYMSMLARPGQTLRLTV